MKKDQDEEEQKLNRQKREIILHGGKREAAQDESLCRHQQITKALMSER